MTARSQLAFAFLFATSIGVADEPVFSGPQPGEKLTSFTTTGALGNDDGRELDFIKSADGKPVVVVFVHKVSRPGVALVRALMTYVESRKSDGITGGIAWLTDDGPETKAFLNRAKHALPKNTPIGISRDGHEGPGAYGLNRNVALTVLVGTKGKVTANYALVQPSVAVDLPKILKSVTDLIGGTPPDVEKLVAMRPASQPGRMQMSPELGTALRALIQKDATADDVASAIQNLEKRFEAKPAERRHVREIARRIINARKLENYGTAPAQVYLKKIAALEEEAKDSDDAKKED